MSANEMIWQQKDNQLDTTWWVIIRVDEKHEKRLTTLKLWNLRSHCQIPQFIFTAKLKNHMQARDEVHLTAFCIFIYQNTKKAFWTICIVVIFYKANVFSFILSAIHLLYAIEFFECEWENHWNPFLQNC